MGGWLSPKNVEEMLEAMERQEMVSEASARRVRRQLDADDASYALELLVGSGTGTERHG